MNKIALYSGSGVSLSPVNAEGRHVSDFVRLVADKGMGITDGTTVTDCIDTREPEKWSDCDSPDPEEDTL